jgi:hypothetical protein
MPTIPTSPQATPPAEAEQAIRLAREDLAGRLTLAAEAAQLVSVEAVDWPDASLGCPQPGMMYAQVVTPGYRVILEAGGKMYEYHTDEGRFAVLCDEGKPSGSAPSKGTDATVQDGGPSQPRDNDVIIVPPAERK